jgi:hypothetical protein
MPAAARLVGEHFHSDGLKMQMEDVDLVPAWLCFGRAPV